MSSLIDGPLQGASVPVKTAHGSDVDMLQWPALPFVSL